MRTAYVDTLAADVIARYPDQPDFLQAVMEVVRTLDPVLERHPSTGGPDSGAHGRAERVILFRVTWVDDGGDINVNRGYGSR